MKVLFISESLWMAGVVFDLHMMAEGLAARGHEVYALDPGEFAAPDWEPENVEHFQTVSRASGAGSVRLRSPRIRGGDPRRQPPHLSMRDRIRRYRAINREIDWILNSAGIDVIVLYSAARCGLPAVRIARKRRVPVVFRNVDMLFKLWPTRLQRWAVRRCEHYVYRRVDKLLALTPNYAAYLARMGAREHRIDILPFPLDLDQFRPKEPPEDLQAQWRLSESDKVIVFVGALYEFGSLVETVLEFPRVLAAEPHARLLIVGGGPLRPRLEELVDEMDLEERVLVLGDQPFARMPDYIALATVCISCFPITDFTRDIFSAKVVQYLAGGKATVAPALPGTMRMLPAGETGVEYAKDAAELADKVIALLGDPDRRREKAALGLDHVRKVHDQHVVVAALERTLSGIVEGQRG